MFLKHWHSKQPYSQSLEHTASAAQDLLEEDYIAQSCKMDYAFIENQSSTVLSPMHKEKNSSITA